MSDPPLLIRFHFTGAGKEVTLNTTRALDIAVSTFRFQAPPTLPTNKRKGSHPTLW